MHLTPSVRRLLRDVARRLCREAVVQKPRGQTVEQLLDWLDEQHVDPGVRLSRTWLRFDRDLLASIDIALEAAGEAPLAVDLSGLSTLEQARRGGREEKSVREAPRAPRVLVSLPAGAVRRGLTHRCRECLDLDWRDIDLETFDALIQVENLDGFYAFGEAMPALASWPCPLVVYRGDHHYGGAFARLAAAWTVTGKPHCYLGDFDAAGLHNALSSSATHLLLPPFAACKAQARDGHLSPQQQEHQAGLRDHAAHLPEDHPLVGYLGILLGEQHGLLQQWLGPAAALEPIPLW